MNEDDDSMYVDLYELGRSDAQTLKQPDIDYCSSEEYMAGYREGAGEC